MVEIGISEFTFGYAFLFEQTQANWGNIRSVPILPSLQQEQQQAWDAHLPLNGIDFYYQFKLSDYLTRNNASFLRDGTYHGPYYRFWLHRRNNNRQHQRLKQHCLVNPNTYYVVPEFNSIEEFNSNFLTKQVMANSRIIPLNKCNDIFDSYRHCITFQSGNPEWILHSESKRQEKSFNGDELGTLYMQSSHKWQVINLAFAEHIFKKTQAIAKRILKEEESNHIQKVWPLIDETPTQYDRHHLLMRTADILSAVLGVTLVLVGSDK